MKKYIIVLTLITSSAFAGNKIANTEAATGAEVILRQVVAKRMLGKDGLRFVKFALEGSGNSQIRSDVNSMECEPTLGSVSCAFEVASVDESIPSRPFAFAFHFTVDIYQGTVRSVQITDDP